MWITGIICGSKSFFLFVVTSAKCIDTNDDESYSVKIEVYIASFFSVIVRVPPYNIQTQFMQAYMQHYNIMPDVAT